MTNVFIRQQLNDWSSTDESCQQWDDSHIDRALRLGMEYLFSLKPDLFASARSLVTTNETCVLQFSCPKVLDVLHIGDCQSVEMQTDQSASILSLVRSPCIDGQPGSFTLTEKAPGIYRASPDIPAGTKVTYICSQLPDKLSTSQQAEYGTLVTSFALWWLSLNDSESRTGPERADRYFQMIQFFVSQKLLLEFSLNEDDYRYGRRRVDDH